MSSERSKGGKPRKLPTPGASRTSASSTGLKGSDAGADSGPSDSSKDDRIAELEAQLEMARESVKTLLERSLASEQREREQVVQLKEAKNRAGDNGDDGEVERLKADSAVKETELQMAANTVNELQTELQVARVDRAELDEIKEKYESSRTRNEQQAVELGTLTAEIQAQRTRLREKEESWAEIKGVQASQVAVLQSQIATLKAELTSLKGFSADQSKFLSNLGEENSKLVAEIKRLKEQAVVRDQQLHESVYLARDAILREKKKREEWERKIRAQSNGGEARNQER